MHIFEKKHKKFANLGHGPMKGCAIEAIWEGGQWFFIWMAMAHFSWSWYAQ